MAQGRVVSPATLLLLYAQARIWKFAADAVRGPRGE